MEGLRALSVGDAIDYFIENLLDIKFESKEVGSIFEYKNMIYKMTACFVEIICEIVAILCGEPNEYVKIVKNYRKYFGIAF